MWEERMSEDIGGKKGEQQCVLLYRVMGAAEMSAHEIPHNLAEFSQLGLIR